MSGQSGGRSLLDTVGVCGVMLRGWNSHEACVVFLSCLIRLSGPIPVA